MMGGWGMYEDDADLRRLILGLIRSGNAADARGRSDDEILNEFGPGAEPFALALRETIRAEIAAALE